MIASSRGERPISRRPSPVSCHSDRRSSPPSAAGAGRRCRPRASQSADTAKVAASMSSAADGLRTATSAPAARKPTTCASCSVMLVSEVATA